ncbi:D-alanine--D-alanine ligase [Fulvivirga sp. 29W222]|uniref:D-alanine--D-alanine ligase n=1 Tax=Fulvivirga marina TaxID=2494733 RepID=A0A937FVG5_9BACT|nr:D-alanine--D-alanine ligase family protein [Fulvivirga marina]MBL6446789.1 D-alanine--D-alanine ligase [Fulvivirga marina]
MDKKLTVAILFGGKSVEHQISINSAKNVFEFIDKEKYTPVLIGISPKGEWFLKEEVNGNFDIKDSLKLILNTEKGGFHNNYSGETITPDLVFPVLHGTDGEDGSIQGLLKVINIPFVGTGVLGSAVSMSKLYSKRLLQAAGIPISKYVFFDIHEREKISFQQLKDELGLPFMAKAANLGSSVGVHKVKSEEDFDHAVADVFNFDGTIIFEQFVKGRELECAVIGNEQPQASLPGEIVVSKDYDFYTYEAKYLDPEAAKLEIPAVVDEKSSKTIQELSVKSYQALKCEDFARVDLFLKENGDIIINEINTIPGFTNSSMFPMMWKERGISFTDLITKLVEMALKRFERNQYISNQFSGN